MTHLIRDSVLFQKNLCQLATLLRFGLAGDIDIHKSITSYLIAFADGAIAWQSRLQKYLAVSSTEVEFVGITKAFKKLLQMKQIVQELGFEQGKYILQCDNQSAIPFAKNSTFHARLNHILSRDIIKSEMPWFSSCDLRRFIRETMDLIC